jgi:hypothetical protein
LNPKQVKGVLENSQKDLVSCLCECMHNVAKGSVPIPPATLSKLKKHRKKIRQILNGKTKQKQRKQLLEQSGGFLPLLLAPIISLVGGLVGEAIGGAINKR